VRLATPEVVDTLDAHDLLDLGAPGRWPGEPDEEGAWPGVEESWQAHGIFTEQQIGRNWGPARQDLLSRAGGEMHVPHPDVFDALPWYLQLASR
jgi:hypothetical protein